MGFFSDVGNFLSDAATSDVGQFVLNPLGGINPLGVPDVGDALEAGKAIGDALSIDTRPEQQTQTLESARSTQQRLEEQAANREDIAAPTMQAGQIGPAQQAQAQTAQAHTAARPQDVTAQTVSAPGIQRTQINQDPQAQARAQQQLLANSLIGQATGTGGPSRAQALLQQQSEAAQAQQLGLASALQGRSPGAALRQASNATAAQQAQIAAQAGALQAQEQQRAQQILGQQLQGLRGQDIGLATSQAGFDQQSNLAAADQALQASLANQQAGLTAAQGNQAIAADLSKFNAGNLTQAGQFNAGLQTDISQFNAAQANQIAAEQAGLTTKAGIANLGAAQSTNRLNADTQFRDEQLILNALGQQGGLSAGVDAANLDREKTNAAITAGLINTAGETLAEVVPL